MTNSEKKLYEFLVQYETDETTAAIIIKGGYMGFAYGIGGYYEFDRDQMDSDQEEFINEQLELGANLLEDVALDHSYLIGSMV